MSIDDLMKLAKSRLEMFERGSLPLHQLVGDLKGIQDSLPDPAPSWKDDFDKHGFALEEVNALRLDEDFEGGDEHDDFVASTVKKLKELVATST